MATSTLQSVSDIVASALHQTIKGEIRRKFIEMVTKDIEPILEEYTRQLVTQVDQFRDPYDFNDIKLNIQFKLPKID